MADLSETDKSTGIINISPNVTIANKLRAAIFYKSKILQPVIFLANWDAN